MKIGPDTKIKDVTTAPNWREYGDDEDGYNYHNQIYQINRLKEKWSKKGNKADSRYYNLFERSIPSARSKEEELRLRLEAATYYQLSMDADEILDDLDKLLRNL